MTVSRFLNGHPNVSAKTARKVSHAIKELGYTPNPAARMLMGQPSNTIGLILPSLSDPFHARLAHHVQQVASEQDVMLWVAASNMEAAVEASVVQQMKRHHVDGILILPTPDAAVTIFKGGPPVVMLDRPLSGALSDAVMVENRHSSMQAVTHLLDHGYRNVLAISAHNAGLHTIEERLGGYRDAMARKGLAPQVVMGVRSANDAAQALRQQTARGPRLEAVFTTNNVATVHVIEAAIELGLTMPEDLALLGFDDFDFARSLRPAISVVRQPIEDIARQAVQLLFRRINAAEGSAAVRILLPPAIVLRGSCGCAGPSAEAELPAAPGPQ